MVTKILHDLSASHVGKVSDKWSLYLSEYDRVFSPYANAPVRFLEIGIQNGGSLELWSAYFPNAAAIVGCDINPDCAVLTYADPRISVIVGDANDAAINRQVLARASEFDIIIDDGSHLSGDIVRSFALYFPKLASGGIFIAEDLHCSYWKGFDGGLFDPHSSISFFKLLGDVINHEHWGVATSRRELLAAIFSKYNCDLSEDELATIHSIEFINSVCIVRKSPTKATLGFRVISGLIEDVRPGHAQYNGKPYQLDPVSDQRANLWSNRPQAPIEDLIEIGRMIENTDCPSPGLAGDVSILQQELADLRLHHDEILVAHQELHSKHAQLKSEYEDLTISHGEQERMRLELLNSFSWRVTDLPRRIVMRLRSWRN